MPTSADRLRCIGCGDHRWDWHAPPGTRSVFLKNPFDHSGPNGRRILRGLWTQQRAAPGSAFQEEIKRRSGVFNLPLRGDHGLTTSSKSCRFQRRKGQRGVCVVIRTRARWQDDLRRAMLRDGVKNISKCSINFGSAPD